MPVSISKVYIHLIFSTKNREAWFDSDDIRGELFKYIGRTLNGLKCPPIKVGGERDHIHALFLINRDDSISKIVRELKISTSLWFKKTTRRSAFAWQSGYGVFSVSKSQVETVIRYINNQAEHHRHKSFQEEFVEFLNAYDAEYDPKYIWD